MNRRNFMAGLGFGAMSFGLNSQLSAANVGEIKSERSVIFLYMPGGMSIADSFCVKPDAAEGYAPINGVIQTKSDYLLGSDFPKLAQLSDKISNVHSFFSKDANHNSAQGYVFTGLPAFGIAEGAAAKNPSYGAMVSYSHGERNDKNGLPNYIKLSKSVHDGAAWLGVKHSGFAKDEDGIKNLQINVTPESFVRRNQMVNEIEKLSGRNDHYFKEWSNLRNSAKEIVMGQAAQAFNLKNENQIWLDKYNVDKDEFGKNCLLSRRMIEAGAKFISISHNRGWDNHSGISKAFKDNSPNFDTYLSTLILDLESKGLLKNTLIVVTSEFSRTKLNSGNGDGAGRDHLPSICPLLLIGGEYGGNVIGKSDKNAISVEGSPFTPEDLNYTILNWLGVDSSFTMIRDDKRPMKFIPDKAKIII